MTSTRGRGGNRAAVHSNYSPLWLNTFAVQHFPANSGTLRTGGLLALAKIYVLSSTAERSPKGMHTERSRTCRRIGADYQALWSA
jgi:hypothetical protein